MASRGGGWLDFMPLALLGVGVILHEVAGRAHKPHHLWGISPAGIDHLIEASTAVAAVAIAVGVAVFRRSTRRWLVLLAVAAAIVFLPAAFLLRS